MNKNFENWFVENDNEEIKIYREVLSRSFKKNDIATLSVAIYGNKYPVLLTIRGKNCSPFSLSFVDYKKAEECLNYIFICLEDVF